MFTLWCYRVNLLRGWFRPNKHDNSTVWRKNVLNFELDVLTRDLKRGNWSEFSKSNRKCSAAIYSDGCNEPLFNPVHIFRTQQFNLGKDTIENVWFKHRFVDLWQLLRSISVEIISLMKLGTFVLRQSLRRTSDPFVAPYWKMYYVRQLFKTVRDREVN